MLSCKPIGLPQGSPFFIWEGNEMMHYWRPECGNLCGYPYGGEWRTKRWELVTCLECLGGQNEDSHSHS